MRLQLPKLQAEYPQTQKIRSEKLRKELKEGWEKIEGVLYYYGLRYLQAIILTELINRHYDDPL